MRACLLAIVVMLACAQPARAFCGFYVAGSSDAPMFNDATHVVLVRKGTRTVLAMQNDYKGPLQDFAIVVPVPAVLHDGDVKTLPRDVFAHVEQMGAPRLVEYWERDPCALEPDTYLDPPKFVGASAMTASDAGAPLADLGVVVEARFAVAEYQIVILSAKDSAGLATYLEQEHYKIPAGAAPLLRPYVESGMKFFVAKVDPQKVAFEGGRAALSPLRFHYDSDEFALPIRLGLANSGGTQDLIVDILAPHQRYQVANYPNVTIPTNLDLAPAMAGKFAAFYTALFDRTVEKNPRAVVTEYAWQATTCDPCPGPALGPADFLTLGADVLDGPRDKPSAYENADFVLTRLHARYGKDVADDLRFVAAAPIVGGREIANANGRLEEGASRAEIDNFQARYAIRHPWTGSIACDTPKRGVWGGPPDPSKVQPAAQAALGLAFAPHGGVTLASAVVRDIPELDVRAGAVAVAKPPIVTEGAAPPKRSGCGCNTGDGGGGAAIVLALLGMTRRRRRA